MIYSKRHKVSLSKMYDPTSIVEDYIFPGGEAPRARGSKAEFLPDSIVYNDEMAMELLRCSQNPRYFISKYVRIQHPIKGTVPFELYNHQEELVGLLLEYRKVICLQSRQAGISSFSLAYLLWSAMFQRGSSSLHASPTHQHAMFAKSIFQSMYNSLPRWLITGVTFANGRGMGFENGACIKFESMHESTGRGRTLSHVVLADFGHVRESLAERVWASVMPGLSKSSMLLVHSSLGENLFFNRQLGAAAAQFSDLYAHKIDCYKAGQHKDLDSTRQMVGEEAFKRQFLCEF